MRVIGLDPALRCTGYGVIELDGRRYRAVDCGVVRNPAKAPVSECMRRIAGGVQELVDGFAPDQAALEGGFYFKNAKTAMVLGMVRGAIVAGLAQREVPVYEYAPRRAKQVVVGHGNADKEQVALVVANMLSLNVSDIPRDATDAMALALCHALLRTSAQGAYLPDPI